MEISHSLWPWLRSDAMALAGYAKMMMMMTMSNHFIQKMLYQTLDRVKVAFLSCKAPS